MAKFRTSNQLQDYLDAEFSWRIKEIADLKTAVRSAAPIPERTLIRAGIALLYAHWEGWVKNSLTAYLNYVNHQGHRYNELKSCMVVFGLKKRLNEIIESKSSNTSIAAIDFLMGELSGRAQLKIDSAINTASNLSSEVLKNLLLSVGFDEKPYETKNNLIDESLLKRRNFIAHGEFVDVAKSDWAILANEVISLMRNIKTDIENAVALKSYKN